MGRRSGRWTGYDCFIARMEARREAKRRASKGAMTVAGQGRGAMGMPATGKPAARIRRAAAQALTGPTGGRAAVRRPTAIKLRT